MPWLFILFVLVPAVELYVLIQIGQTIGALQTFGIIIATGLLGSYMAKTQGLKVWNSLNQKLGTGQIPGKELTDGAIILVSGTLLITPGIITDVVGLIGLLPFTRALIRRLVQSWFKNRAVMHMSSNISGGFTTFHTGSNQAVPNPEPPHKGSAEWSGKAKDRPSVNDM